MQSKKIAIIGGGIAGLTFSICLKCTDYQCNIFEKKDEFGEIGAAISVFPNALQVLKELGLMNEILATSGIVQKIFLKTEKGAILSKTIPKNDLPVICTHRADLHRVLLNHTTAGLHSDHTLKTLKHLTNGQIELNFENGHTDIFDAVIGADGIHSVVRQHIINDGEPKFRGYNVWRGVCKTNFDTGYGSETFGKGKRFGIVPVKNGVYGWWSTYNEEFMKDDQPEGSRQKLIKLFGNWHDPIPELLANTEHILKNSLSDRIPKKGWTNGNATLLGDAAHPSTPNLGQGGCMAIEGAYILANAVKNYGISEKAFKRYEELQYPRSKSIVEASLQLGKIGQLENSLAVFFRNLAFKMTPSKLSLKMVDKYFSYKVTELKI